MTTVTHTEKPRAIGTILHHNNRLGETITGYLFVEFGDSFIITHEASWNVYNKVEPNSIILL